MMWFEFIGAFALFFLTHSVPVRPAIRMRLVAHFGRTGFTVAYSILSLGALAWVIGAAGRAPYVQLWAWAPWQNIVTSLIMAGVCVLLGLSIGMPNPFSFAGACNAEFDADNPGIIGYTRHPLLSALALWAFAHMLPNGDLAHVLLFGIFGTFAVLGCTIIDRRKERQMGSSWAELLRRSKSAKAIVHTENPNQTALRVVVGLTAYLALFVLHPRLFGVSPLF